MVSGSISAGRTEGSVDSVPYGPAVGRQALLLREQIILWGTRIADSDHFLLRLCSLFALLSFYQPSFRP